MSYDDKDKQIDNSSQSLYVLLERDHEIVQIGQNNYTIQKMKKK